MPPTRKLKIRLAAIAGTGLVLAGLIVGLNLYYSRTGNVGLPAPPPVPPSTQHEGRVKADDVLSKIKPGMLRVDVETILGPPSAVDSIAAGNGKLSYRATFNRDKLRPPMPPIVLEFDATQTGHPLLMIKPM